MPDDDSGFSLPFDEDKLKSLAEHGKQIGASFIIPSVQSAIRERLSDVFADAGAEELERYILVNYPLVEKRTPDRLRKVLANNGPNYEDEIRMMVTPQNILHWLENPEWVDEENEEYKDTIQECARTIRETPGGEQWLTVQVIAVWRMAGIDV